MEEIKRQILGELRSINRSAMSGYLRLSEYLTNEYLQGKAEFRIHVNSDKTFYIHPMDKDGKTYDGELI